MRRILAITLSLLTLASAFALDSVSFSGGYSRLVLKEGMNTLVLSEGAKVKSGTIEISANEMSLSGDGYSRIECDGSVSLSDEDRGLSIKTSSLLYDRNSERLLISSWVELSDRENSLEALSASLYYDMEKETLSLEMQVRLVMDTDSGILRATGESVTFNRKENTLLLRGIAKLSGRETRTRLR